jgi:DHA2 family multidrug resistance protein
MLTSFAFVMFAVVLFLRSRFNTQADFGTVMFPTILQGIAVAFFFIPLTTITLGGLPPAKIASASGLTSFARMVGGSFGTSIAITVWQDRAALHHAQLAETINQGNSAAMAALSGFNAAGMTPEQGLSQINRMLDQQAYMLAANDVFYASAVIFVLLIPMVWLSRPARASINAGSADAAAGAH